MNASSEDIKAILEAYGESSGLSLILGDNLFIGQQPSKPSNCVTIYDTGGPVDLSLINQGYERPSIQIRVRDTTYQSGWDLITRIKSVLHGISNRLVNGTLYTVIYCSSGPALLEYDDNGLVHFIINFNIQRR